MIEIGPVVIEIRGVENDEIVVPVKITHLCATRLSWRVVCLDEEHLNCCRQ